MTARGIIAITLLASLLVWPRPTTTLAADSGAITDQPVRIMVALRSSDADWPAEVPGRESRRISRRTSRYYRVGGEDHRARDMTRWRVIDVAAQEAEQLLEDLHHSPVVEQAYFERVYEAAFIPNDPLFNQQYGLYSATVSTADISAPAAWEVTTGSSDTVIAVLDGGVDLTHEDLVDSLWVNNGEVPGNGIDDDSNGFSDDVYGWDFVPRLGQPAGLAIHSHATHVAGVAAADGNNGRGVAGVNWGARIMSVRVLGSSGVGQEESVIQGIEYAVANGADVINMSIAGLSSPALLEAIEHAYAAGVVVVAAAGNNGLNTDVVPVFPACADNAVNLVLGVGATNDVGEPASFSNYGRCVDVSAPGDDILSSVTGNRYREMSGTSMSAPMVAGAAGLYLTLHPNASVAEVMSAVRTGDALVGRDDEESAEWTDEYAQKLNIARVVGASVAGRVEAGTTAPLMTPGPDTTAGRVSTAAPAADSGGGGGGGGDCCSGSQSDSDATSFVPVPKPRVAGAVVRTPNLSLVPKINAAFRSVFGRSPNGEEHSYWLARVQRGDKRSFEALIGAMRWQQLQGATYVQRAAGEHGPVGAGSASARSLVSHINARYRTVYGRNPTSSEHGYWMSRVMSGEKTSRAALVGAMMWHRLAGLSH